MVKVFVVAFCLFSFSVFADVQVHDGLVTADLQSQPLTQVLERLKAQANVSLMIDDGVAGKTVSANFQDLPVAMALKKMLEGTGINYVVLAGEDGQPASIFIGGSSRPGAPPRRIDNRPVNSRGVVTPVNPPPVPVPQAQPETMKPNPETRGLNPNVNVPTGGGFVPSTQTQPPNQDQQQDQQQEENSDNNNEN